jgi:hypothetical protein
VKFGAKLPSGNWAFEEKIVPNTATESNNFFIVDLFLMLLDG